jgi:hypothetical protein
MLPVWESSIGMTNEPASTARLNRTVLLEGDALILGFSLSLKRILFPYLQRFCLLHDLLRVR